MQIFRAMAGYSLGRADIVRRAMSKKKKAIMEREHQIFIHGLVNEKGEVEVEGCVRRGVSEEVASAVYAEMQSFASYAFNKSHAAAYATVAYQTAWMKCKHPREYMAALLTSVLDYGNKVAEYIAECQRLGIRVLPPHVNESGNGFTVSGRDIRFGLLAVRNLGRGMIKALIAERERGGRFTSFYDFCKRMHGQDMNRRALESLIKCGALDNLGSNRRQMLTIASNVMEDLDQNKKRNLEGQLGLFDTPGIQATDNGPEMPAVDEFPMNELLAMEKEVTGMYLSGHPMAAYATMGDKLHCARVGDIMQAQENGLYTDGAIVTLLCIITSVRLKTTKSNSTMAFVQLEDMYGSIEMLVFPKTLMEFAQMIKEGNVVLVHGRLSLREEEDAKLVCDQVTPPPGKAGEQPVTASDSGQPSPQKKSARPGLYVQVPNLKSAQYERAKLLISIFEGTTPVYYFCQDTRKLMLAPAAMWCDVNDVLLGELKNQLGDENVVIRK